MKIDNVFTELKRRNIYKVAVACAIVSWLLIQIATQVFPLFGIPNWAVRLVVLLLTLGFPAALIFARRFEITPENIKRESEVEPNKSIARKTGRKKRMTYLRIPNGILVCLGATLLTTRCQKTGKLSSELNARFEKEGIVRRADDLTFRRTIPAGQRASGWDERRASIVVTRESVFLHVNGKPLVEITSRSTGFYEVHRDHDRLSLHIGSGKSAASWSFRPPDDPEGWAIDIRAVIKNAKSR